MRRPSEFGKRSIFNRGLAPDRLRIKTHQLIDLLGNLSYHMQAEGLGLFIGDGIIMSPSTLREDPAQFF